MSALPPPPMPVVTARQCWEYLVVDYNPRRDTLARTLNELGSQGWELVHVEDKGNSAGAVAHCTLKRPVTP